MPIEWPSWTPQAAGFLISFLAAALVVAFDCHASAEKLLSRVPIAVYRLPYAWALSGVCGLLAGGAFLTTDGTGNSWVDKALGLGESDAILRGFYVGVGVLVLIRSRILTIKDSELGAEYLYSRFRAELLKSLSHRWHVHKTAYYQTHKHRFFDDPTFETELVDAVRANIAAEPEAFRTRVEELLGAIKRNAPATPFDRNAADWNFHYRSLTYTALDACGSRAFTRWQAD